MDDHEEFEHVPWSELSDAASGRRPSTISLVAALVGAVVLGVVVGRMLGSSGSVAAEGPPVAASETAEVPDTSGAGTGSSAPAATVTVPGLYAEADLMAVAVEGPERAAATRAEWFVYDFFTADMEPVGSGDVLSALPAGVELPDMPQDSVSSLSYVEWARAFRVEPAGEDLYRVAVVFRVLGAPPDRGFFRLGARAVEVMVAVSADGGTVVADLPTPIALPAAPEPDPWPRPGEEEAPSQVVDQAIVLARAWGDEARLVGTQPIDGGWRVVLTVADEVGNRWPISVRVDANGDRLVW